MDVVIGATCTTFGVLQALEQLAQNPGMFIMVWIYFDNTTGRFDANPGIGGKNQKGETDWATLDREILEESCMVNRYPRSPQASPTFKGTVRATDTYTNRQVHHHMFIQEATNMTGANPITCTSMGKDTTNKLAAVIYGTERDMVDLFQRMDPAAKPYHSECIVTMVAVPARNMPPTVREATRILLQRYTPTP